MSNKIQYHIWNLTPIFIKKILFNYIVNKERNIQYWSILLTNIINKNIKVGCFSYIDKWAKISANSTHNISIWKYSSIAYWVYIISYNHNIELITPHINQINHKVNISNETKWWSIKIWNDVWIWANAIILPWVNIWDWSVIWAWSVVTKDIEPYSIYAWNPAKLIKKRFSKTKTEKLLDIEWWNWSNKKIKKNKDFFNWDINNIVK